MCAYLLAKERADKDFARQAGAWGEDPHNYPIHVTYWVNGGPKGPRVIENAFDADDFIETSKEFFQICVPWLEYNEEDRPVCRLTSADFQEVIQRMASIFGAFARHASDEALAEIDSTVAKQYVQAILKVVKRETTSKFYMRSGVIKEPAQTVIDSCVGWFRMDAVNEAALEDPDGLVATICKIVLDQKRPPSPVFMTTCMMMCENIARMTRGLSTFQLAMDLGVLQAGVHGVALSNATIAKHATKLLKVCAGEPSTMCRVLVEGSKAREAVARAHATAGLNEAARGDLGALLDMSALCELGLGLKDSNQWVGEECFPLPKSHACAHCRAAAAKLRCSRCNETYYCNSECQKKHWREHKTYCASVQLRQPDLKGLRRLVTGFLSKHADRLKQSVIAAIQRMQDGDAGAGEGGADLYALCKKVVLCIDCGAWQDAVLTVTDVLDTIEDRIPPFLVEMEEECPDEHEELIHAVQDVARGLQPKQLMVLVRMPGPAHECAMYLAHLELKKSGRAKKKKSKAKGAAADAQPPAASASAAEASDP